MLSAFAQIDIAKDSYFESRVKCISPTLTYFTSLKMIHTSINFPLTDILFLYT